MKLRVYYKLVSVWILCMSPALVFADEHEAPQADLSTEVQATQEPSTAQENNLPPDSFVPTESISEDLSVPFPVDI